MRKSILVAVISTLLICGCSKDSAFGLQEAIIAAENNGGSQGGNGGGNSGGNNNHSSQNTVVVKLESANPGNLNVSFRPTEGVAYYKCGIGSHMSRYTEERTIKYSYLNPISNYTVRAIAYDANDRELNTVNETFRTSSAPYDIWMRSSPDVFKQIAYCDMRIESLANYHKKKCLRFVGTEEGVWMQVAYVSAAFETVNKMWDEGTYSFSDGHATPRYYVEYNLGGNSISYITDGTMTISRGGNIFNIKVRDKDSDNMIVAQFAGTLQN